MSKTPSPRGYLPLSTFACAKINLMLDIVGRRDDGYHLLNSLIAFAEPGTDACDHLTLFPHRTLELSVSGSMAADIGSHDDNLVLKAAELFADVFPDSYTGHFHLIKRLPVASGIGGGSADAAAALRLLAQLNDLPETDIQLFKIASELGADVPVCLEQTARFVTGIGDELGDYFNPLNLPVVLINPGIPVSTPSVFKALNYNAENIISSKELCPVPECCAHSTLVSFLERNQNALEFVATKIVPAVDDVLQTFKREDGCLFSQMSGSGATVFGVFTTSDDACAAAKKIKHQSPQWWVASTTLC